MGCSSSIHAAPSIAAAQAAEQGAAKPQPITPDSRVLRGQAYYAAGKLAEALKEFNAIIATWPTYARAYLERGNVRLDQKDYPLAIGDYSMALQIQGNLLQAYMMRCHARIALRQYVEAMQDARDAERLDPENAQVKALKAQVRKAQASAVGAGAVPTLASIVGGSTGGSGEEEDAFAGLDTPKSTPSPSVRKLCMVCMDSERECRLRPCMHAALCVACAEGLMARGYGCPICSSKIEVVERGSFMRTFSVEEAQGIVASARVVAPLASPGKSPLGRRFQSGPVPVGPSLDNIVEGDEEGHTSADAAIESAAAALAAAAAAGADESNESLHRRRMSSSSLASTSGRPTTPPVVLDPHPLAGRLTASARVMRRSSSDITNDSTAATTGEEATSAGPPPPLPGEVVSYDEADVVTGNARQAVVSRGDALGASSADIRTPHRRRSGGGGGGDGDDVVYETDGRADMTPPALTPVASTYLANSLADWIEEHSGGESPVRPAVSPAKRTALPPVEETSDATAAEDSDIAEGRQDFTGFASMSTSAAVAQSADARLPGTEIEPETGANGDVGPSAAAAVAAAPFIVSTNATAEGTSAAVSEPEAAGPVTESCCSRPASAASTMAVAGPIAGMAGRLSFHTWSQNQQHRYLHSHHQHHYQCSRPWSARSIAARSMAEPAIVTVAAASDANATFARSYKALGGAYASCGAAAAAARPFTRERFASGQRGYTSVLAVVQPSTGAFPQQPWLRSGRRGEELPGRESVGAIRRGLGVGGDIQISASRRSRSGGDDIGCAAVRGDVLLLPGTVPS